ncbi:hypothetical protein ACQUSR_02305 [Streptomyces sp. P1-3]|uniref:hypothetical protein n=1 Tax=Streptomyces sp. P1-3 TaxID=3421658 RepID=UPI003D36CAF9
MATTAPQVTAAYIAASAAGATAVVGLLATVWNGRWQRSAEMLMSALKQFEGQSQPRSAGIAALRVLSQKRVLKLPWGSVPLPLGAAAAWRSYQETVSELFYRQLLYLFAHGRNRWQSHEIENIIAMTDWLLSGKSLEFDDADKKMHLYGAMTRYLDDWRMIVKAESKRLGSRPDASEKIEERLRKVGDVSAVSRLEGKIAKWEKSLKEAKVSGAGQEN